MRSGANHRAIVNVGHGGACHGLRQASPDEAVVLVIGGRESVTGENNYGRDHR